MKLAAIAVCALALFVASAGSASAQAVRTWVSGVGDDANPCSRTAPCKTFAGAISKTADNGIIDILDPGGFGAVTITKGITLRSTSENGGILASGLNGVIVNAPGKVVNLVNLQIDGSPLSSPGQRGVQIIAASQVIIENCRIQGFLAAESGIGVAVASTAKTKVSITDTKLYGNNIGIDVAPAGSARNAVVLDRVYVENNGASVRGAGSKARITVRGSTLLDGIEVLSGAEFRSYGDNALPDGFVPTAKLPLR